MPAATRCRRISSRRRCVAQAVHRRNHGRRRASSSRVRQRGRGRCRVRARSRHRARARRRRYTEGTRCCRGNSCGYHDEHGQLMGGIPLSIQHRWPEIVQALVAALAVFVALRRLRWSGATRVAIGFVILAAAYALAWMLDLRVIAFLLRLLLEYGIIALLVVFAPELRAMVTQLGRTPFSRTFREMGTHEVAEEIHEVVERLSRSGIGAIIAVERD